MPEKSPINPDEFLDSVLAASEAAGETLKVPNLEVQYQSQAALLEKLGLLETLSSGKKGLIDIKGQEQLLPTLQEFSLRLSPEQKALIERKAEQGFTRVFLVPFGRELNRLTQVYAQIIKDYFVEDPTNPVIDPAKPHIRRPDPQRTRLLATDGTKLNLDTNQPLWVWEKYANADKEGKLIYLPKKFDKTDHQGKTKDQIIQGGQAWQLVITEDLADLPAEGKGKPIQGRKQLEANLTGHQYLEKLQGDPQYQGETGLTPEAQIIRALTYLEEKNQVVDDYQGQGKANWLLGAYFPEDGYVPRAYWDRGSSRARLGGGDPRFQDSDGAALPSVTI